MPVLAELIEVVQQPDGSFSLKVDGTEFPWFIAPGLGVTVSPAEDEMAGVELRILADRVKVDDNRFGPRG